jgi:hypothetical protein
MSFKSTNISKKSNNLILKIDEEFKKSLVDINKDLSEAKTFCDVKNKAPQPFKDAIKKESDVIELNKTKLKKAIKLNDAHQAQQLFKTLKQDDFDMRLNIIQYKALP